MKASFVLIVAGLVAGTGVAFADGDGSDASGGPPAAPDANGGSAMAAPTPAAAPANWMQMDSRPLTVPAGKLAIHIGVPFVNETTVDVTTGNSSSTLDIIGSVGVTYGVNDKLEVGANYTIPINPNGSVQGILTARAAYLAAHSEKLDFALAAALDVDTNTGNDTVVSVGAWVRYRAAPKLSIFTGQIPGTPEFLSPGALITGIGGNQFTAEVNNLNLVLLSIPVGAGYQVTPNVWAYAQTDLATFLLNPNSSQAFIFSDFIPVQVGAYYSMDKIDVGLAVADDLKDAGDTYFFILSGRYWIK